MIKPTVGRIVWFFTAGITNPPLAAIIARVNDGGTVNLAVFSVTGEPFAYERIRLLQDGEDRPDSGNWAEWMPYQKGQAAKTEALENKIMGESHAMHSNWHNHRVTDAGHRCPVAFAGSAPMDVNLVCYVNGAQQPIYVHSETVGGAIEMLTHMLQPPPQATPHDRIAQR